MDSRIVARRSLNCLLLVQVVLLAGCLHIKERFNHAQLGEKLRIESVEFSNSQGDTFRLSPKELASLEDELGRLTIHDFTIDERRQFIESGVTAKFKFSDGYERDIPVEHRRSADQFALDFSLPDDPAFQGSIPVYARFERVVSSKRLEDFEKVFLGKGKKEEIDRRVVK